METKKVFWIVPPTLAGERLDKALSFCDDVSTRSQAELLIKASRVRVNGKKSKTSQRVISGDQVEIEIFEETATGIVPLEGALEVLFEDKDLIVVNKPSGLVVHPAAGHQQDTLVNLLVHHSPELGKNFSTSRPGIVHRLDKDTSGVMVVAKNTKTSEFLASQFKDRTVGRRYWALVYGSPKPANGRIESRLARHPSHRKKFASTRKDGLGKVAITDYKTLRSHKAAGVSWVECKLHTGRTHQIRVHLLEKTCSVVGDPIYGNPRRQTKAGAETKALLSSSRLALHAFELEFKHPNGKTMHFSSEWPKDLHPLLERLNWI